ncbi:unnamed protein product, partial [Cladocopium goreaui]
MDLSPGGRYYGEQGPSAEVPLEEGAAEQVQPFVQAAQGAQQVQPFVQAAHGLRHKELRAFVLEEKGLAMSGEDFEVKTPEGQLVLKINGGNRVPIPGVVWDKLSLVTAGGQEIATLDRQAFAMTASYDLKRADGQKFGRISKAMFAFTSTFELYQEDDPEGGPLLKAEGSFSDKNYVMKSRSGRVVATVTRLKGFTG